jgi:hypothetical protein
MMARPLQPGDRVRIASQSIYPRPPGTIRQVNAASGTAHVEWDDAEAAAECLTGALKRVPADTCPVCGAALHLTAAEHLVPNRRLDGGAWRGPATVLACTGCEYVEVMP